MIRLGRWLIIRGRFGLIRSFNTAERGTQRNKKHNGKIKQRIRNTTEVKRWGKNTMDKEHNGRIKLKKGL